MRRRVAPIDLRDAPILALARAHIEARGPLGDAQLVDLVEHVAIAGRARESLLRLEDAGYLKFGPSGWHIPPSAPAIFYSVVLHVW